MGVLKRRFCVDMIGGNGMYLLARVRRVFRSKFSTVLLTGGGRMRNILLLSLAARY